MAPTTNQLTCECGSTFFYTVRAEQFAAGGYGTAEFRSMSNAPKTILVCLCGKVVAGKPSHFGTRTVAGIAEEDFRKALEGAQKYRTEHSLDNIAQIAASPAELEELRTQVDEVRKAFELSLVAKPKAVKPKSEKTKVA